MRNARYAWLLFVLALAAIAVPIAEGTPSAKDPRVPALARKVAVLQGNVAALKDDVATLQKSLSAVKKQADTLATNAGCLGVQGAVQRGDGVREGYVYTTNGGSDTQLGTAIDTPDQGETPDFLLAVVDPQCAAGSTRALFSPGIAP